MPKGFNSFAKKERASGGLNPAWWSKGLTFWAPFDRVADPLKLHRGVGVLSFTRATPATYFPPGSGTRSTASSGELRIEDDGALIEGQRINHFLQSATPATQISGSLGTGTYTLWMEGTGSIAVSANSATITGTGTATDGNPVTFVVTGAGTVDYTVTGSPTIAQAENGPFPSSYIPTTTAAVTRDLDVITIARSGNALDDVGTGFATVDVFGDDSTNANNYGLDLGTYAGVLYRRVDDIFAARDGSTNLAGPPWNWNTSYKVAHRWSTVGGLRGSVNGGDVYTTTFDGGMGAGATMYIGNAWDMGQPLFGHLKNLRLWNRAFSDSELQLITTP